MRKFVSEHQSPYLDLTTEVSDILYRGHSQFQDIIVADSKEFGRMLVLDGVFQTSIKDEFMYHESIVHIPLFLHPNPKKVLIIGGGTAGCRSRRWPGSEHHQSTGRRRWRRCPGSRPSSGSRIGHHGRHRWPGHRIVQEIFPGNL